MKKICIYLLLLLLLSTGALVALVVQPGVQAVQGNVSPLVDVATLEADVRMFAETLHPRAYDHPDNLERAVRYIVKRLANAGGRVHLQTFPVEEMEYSNVIAEFGPEGGPVLIVGAHYDSYGENYYDPPFYTPGADDNASGVAGLLALADLLGKYPPKCRVQLVAYCLEEPPFFRTEHMGSAVHATAAHAENETVLGMICLEMLGYFSDAEGSQGYPVPGMDLIYPDKGNFIGIVGRFQDMSLTRTVKAAMLGASELPVYSISALPLIPGIDFSDHRNYWPHGHEAVMITDTAFYRNHAYHTQKDLPDSLDYGRMAKVVQGVFAAVMHLAE